MNTLLLCPPWAAQPAWTGTWAEADAGLLQWEDASALPPSRELVLVVPAALLSWHDVDLPKIGAGRWRAALESLLEDKLLVEPDQLHLALEPGARAGRRLKLVACQRAWLRGALQALAQAGRQVTRIVPEFEPGPAALHLQGQPERGWLVACTPQSVHALPLGHPLPEALQTAQAVANSLLAQASASGAPGASPETAAAPAPEVPVHAEPSLAAAAERAFGSGAHLVQPGHSLRMAAASGWNLAQFELTPSTPLARSLGRQSRQWLWEPAWRPARWGLAALLLVHLLGLNTWAWLEQRAQADRQQTAQRLLTDNFPNVTLVLDPLLQMQRETERLARASGMAGTGDLGPMLTALAPWGTRPAQRIDHQKRQLTLVGWQPLGEAAAAALARSGYQLEAQGDAWILRERSPGSAP